MEHLNVDELWDFVKYHRELEKGFDENNNMDEKFTNLAIKVNTHISKCEMCKKNYNEMKEKGKKIEITKQKYDEEKHGINEQTLDEFNSLSEELETTAKIEIPKVIDPINEMNFEITEEMVSYYRDNPDELENTNYTSAQKEAVRRSIRKSIAGKQLVLTKNSNGYADALILALITGFAGGIFVSILLMLCK